MSDEPNPYESRRTPDVPRPTGTGAAFIKGGCGCLAAFAVLGLVAVLFGGHMHIDLGGALCLFVVGGLIGLIALAIYQKGARDAGGSDEPPGSRF